MLYTLISMNETMSLVYKLGKKIFVRIINFIIVIYLVKKITNKTNVMFHSCFFYIIFRTI